MIVRLKLPKDEFVNAPGDIYVIPSINGSITAVNQPPTKLINFTSASSSVGYGIGVDGNVYQAALPAYTWTTRYTTGKAKVLLCYYSTTDDLLVINDDGTADTYGTIPSIPSDDQGKIVGPLSVGSGPNIVGYNLGNNVFQACCTGTGRALGSVGISSQNTWQTFTFNVPGRITKIVGLSFGTSDAYSLENIAMLTEDGEVYTVCTKTPDFGSGGPPTGGTNASQTYG